MAPAGPPIGEYHMSRAGRIISKPEAVVGPDVGKFSHSPWADSDYFTATLRVTVLLPAL